MSFDAMLTAQVHVEVRTPETSSWVRQTTRAIPLRITALRADQARTESELHRAAITHVGRGRPSTAITPGCYLRGVEEGQLYRVRAVRQHPVPPPNGQMILSLEVVHE